MDHQRYLLLMLIFMVAVATGGALPAGATGQETVIHDWSERFGGASTRDEGTAVALDGEGNQIVVGYVGSLFDSDVVVAKYTPDGTLLWRMDYETVGSSGAEGVTVDSDDNVIFTGRFEDAIDFGGGEVISTGESDIFLVKLDSDGMHLWSRTSGGAGSDLGFGVATNGRGDIFLTGTFRETIDLGGGPLTSAGATDVYLARFDAAGTLVWNRRFGGPGTDFAGRMDVADPTGVAITGSFSDAIDFGGGPLTSAGMRDIYVALFDENGAHRLSRRFGGEFLDFGADIAVGRSGHLLVAGGFFGEIDLDGQVWSGFQQEALAFRLDDEGTVTWSLGMGGSPSPWFEGAYGIAVDGAGNIAVCGDFAGTMNLGGEDLVSAGDADAFVARFDAGGNHLWSAGFGGRSSDRPRDVELNATGAIALTGTFVETIDLGGGPLFADGLRDGFVARFALTLTGQFDELESRVRSLALRRGIEVSLLSKLSNARRIATDLNAENDHAAVNQLHAFVHEVEAQTGKAIPADVAGELTFAAGSIAARVEGATPGL